MLLTEERSNFKEEIERVTSELKTSTKKTEMSLKKKVLHFYIVLCNDNIFLKL